MTIQGPTLTLTLVSDCHVSQSVNAAADSQTVHTAQATRNNPVLAYQIYSST